MSLSIPGYRIVKRLHESGPRVVALATRERDGEEVVLKTLGAQYPSKRDVAELRREYQLARSLRGVSGVIRVHALETHGHGSVAIVMEPFGLSLAELLRERAGRPLPLEPFLELALRLTEILGELHQRKIVHKDVVPRNVLVKPRQAPESFSELCLIDFGISSELHRERQSTTLSKRLEGSLPYISPEQTGRTNRDLDYRSDYYSLGVTFFELLTGKLPFAADGPLEWVHRHISMPAPSASSENPEVPTAVSAIVLKLMSKNAEERYQSGYGLSADLRRCLDSLRAHNRIEDFELGRYDVSRSFRLPQRLYGRDTELSRLESCFQDVASGLTDVCVLSGASGVGKSALACELTSSIVARGGYLVVGKFEQFQQSGAYSAFARAFDGLVRQLLGETRERLDAWRTALSDALGPSLRLIVELVPALELVTGPCPALARLPPTEAQNRFQLAFVNFVKVVTENSPLVVFMDDLQWSDAPTLSLLQRLATAREMRRLLVIGAFRSNLVDAGHPLNLMLDEVRKARAVTELSLRPLELPAIQKMLADALHCSTERVSELAGVVFQKAHGNPFFVRALLQELVDEGTIHFDAAAGRWDFDLEAARRKGVSENVVEFVAGGLRRLPPPTQQVLELAACIGSAFDLRTLAVIHERSPSATARELQPAVKQGVLLPTNDQYKLVALDPELEPDGAAPESCEPDFNPGYRFQHDRVQQAAYALIDPARKQSVHLSIGRLMHEHATEAELEERLLQIAAHLNAGRKLLESPAERLELARLNWRAARKAMASAAYDPALVLLEHGQDSLPDDRWESEYELSLGLAHDYQQCAYLTGDHPKAELWVEVMLEHARTKLEKARILSQRTRQYATTGKMRESIQAAIAGLSLLDIAITEEPSPDTIRVELDRVRVNLAGRSIPSLIDAPRLTDARQLVAIELLMEIFPAAFLSASGNLFPYLVLKAVNLSLEHGNSPESAFAYAAYGMLLSGALEDPALGYEFGTLAVAMNEQFEDIKLKSRVIYVYAMFIHHWTYHWSSMTPWFQRGIEAGYQSGDLLYLAYSAQDCVIWDPKLDLETATAEQRKYLTIVRDCKYRDSFDSGSLFLQMQLNFQGLTRDTFSLSDDGFNELECVSGMLERRFITGIANFHIYKAEIHFLYGDYAGALEHVVAHEGILASSMSLPQLVRARLLAFLTRSALLGVAGRDQRAEFESSLREILAQFTRWAAHCNENFEHLRLLMEAELAAHSDDMRRALSLYDAAIQTARRHGFIRDEAVANEAAARYLAGAGVPKAGEAYLRAAQYLYYRWGAKRKLHELRRVYAELPELGESDTRSVGTHRETTSSRHVESLDMASVMKASHAISGEVVLERLWKVTLQILLENAGGQRGFLIVRKGESLFIEARGEAGVDAPAMTGAVEVGSAGPDSALPLSVLNSVFRSREAVILNDATQAGRFAADPYMASHRPQSLLCVPVRHGQFDAALYIENTLTRGALTEERIEVVRLLSAQAAISTENAELYEAQLRLIEAQRRFVPSQFLESLGHHDIAEVGLGEYVAREMSVLFSDLRDFTPLAERLKPGKVIELLNEYFSRVGAPIMEMGGFIDTYNGDEIMALFAGSPEFAVRAGVGMHRALGRFNRDFGSGDGPELAMGIGVNTGPLVLGTVGARERLKCGVVGDTVNLASRIEQLTKRYGAPFLIGESTYAGLAPDSRLSIRIVDRVAVKGKQRGVTLYEVLDAESDERREKKLATCPLLQTALASYGSRDFADARDSFGVMAELDPDDRVPRIFLERCQRYLEQAPPDDWRGYESLHFK